MRKILFFFNIIYGSVFSVSALAAEHITADAIENSIPIGQEINFGYNIQMNAWMR